MERARLELVDFAAAEGDRVVVEGGDVHAEMVIASAEPLGAAGGAGRAFSVLFHGPVQPLLAQGTYTLRHEGLGDPAVFVVPIAQTPDHSVYEAVFSRLAPDDGAAT